MRSIELSHNEYISDRRYRRIVHATIRNLAAGRGQAVLSVIHEPGDTCCRRQAWDATAANLFEALAADGCIALLLSLPPSVTT